MKSKNVQFIFYLILFTIVLDFVCGKIFEFMYFTEKSQKQDRLIHSAIGTKEDVLIFGSSRAYHHYNPKIIEDSLGMTCYNVGYGGQNIYFHLALLESALERYKPKVAILELMSIDFEQTTKEYETEKLAILLPFAKKSKSIYQTVLLKSWTEKFKLSSTIYPLNSKLLYFFRNNFTTVNSDYKGFVGLDRVWIKPIEEMKYKEIKLDTKKLDALYHFIDLCFKKNIMLIVSVSPHYQIKSGYNEFEEISNKLYDKYGVKLHNFESDTAFLNHPEYFADPFHLNASGANKYTGFVSEIISIEGHY